MSQVAKPPGEAPSSPQTNGGVTRTVIRRSIVTPNSTASPEKPIIRRGASIKNIPPPPSPGEGQNGPPAHGSPGSPEQTEGSPPTPSAQNRVGSVVRGTPKRIVPRVTPDSSPSTPTSTPPTPTQLGSSPVSPIVPSVEGRIMSLRRITKPVLPESPRDGGDLSARRRSNGLESSETTTEGTPTTPNGTVLPSALTRSMSRRRQQYMNAQSNGTNLSPTSPNTPSLESGNRTSLSQEELLGQLTPRTSDSPKDDSTDESSFSTVTPQMHKIMSESRSVSNRRRSGGLNLAERQCKDIITKKRGLSFVTQQLCKEDPMRFVNPNLDFANTTTVSRMTDEEIAECYNVQIVRGSELSKEHVAVHIDEKEPEETLVDFIQSTKDGSVTVPYRQFFRNPLHNSTIMDIPPEIYMSQEEVSKYNDIVLRLLDTNQDINDFVVFQNEWDNPLHSLLSEQQRIAIKKKNTDRHEKAVVAMLNRSTSIRKGGVILEPRRPYDFSLEHCGKNWKMQLRSLRSDSLKETTKDKYTMTNACVYIYDWKYQIERTKSFQRAQAILELKRTNTV